MNNTSMDEKLEFNLANGVSLHIWIEDSPVGLYARACDGGAKLTVAIKNLIDDEDGSVSIVLAELERTLIGGHSASNWALLYSLAYGALSVFDIDEADSVDGLIFGRVCDQFEALRVSGIFPMPNLEKKS